MHILKGRPTSLVDTFSDFFLALKKGSFCLDRNRIDNAAYPVQPYYKEKQTAGYLPNNEEKPRLFHNLDPNLR